MRDYDHSPNIGDRVILNSLYEYYRDSSYCLRIFPKYLNGKIGTIIKRINVDRANVCCECEFKVMWDGETKEKQYPASFFEKVE